MNIINRAAIESSCKFIEEQIAPRKCDNDAVGSCWRCNSVYLAKRMRDLLADEVRGVDAEPEEPSTFICDHCGAPENWMYLTNPAPSQPAAPVELPVVAWRTRFRSEPGMIGHYPWAYAERAYPASAHETEPLVKLSDAKAAIAAGRKA